MVTDQRTHDSDPYRYPPRLTTLLSNVLDRRHTDARSPSSSSRIRTDCLDKSESCRTPKHISFLQNGSLPGQGSDVRYLACLVSKERA
ncbi:hypothetical protein SKAU_G00270720 [Synaphobranchus kaupii]|uniref:Uncharacterized protein n=1 Tax=Synaphobranchus kaupii TaxID=118154 RepID=A0A9Q1F093_SYNKA|nr:hypothetical protein SKAU_G00270720 [Synaphobranchus kaupii]